MVAAIGFDIDGCLAYNLQDDALMLRNMFNLDRLFDLLLVLYSWLSKMSHDYNTRTKKESYVWSSECLQSLEANIINNIKSKK